MEELRFSIGWNPKKEIGELLLENLTARLATLRTQAEAFSNREWLVKQNAADLAVLHGVMTDKVIKLLDAYGKAS